MNSALSTRYRTLVQETAFPFVLGTGSFLVGLVGEVLLFRPTWRPVGALLLGIAMLGGAIAWRGVREIYEPDDRPTAWGRSRATVLRFAGVGGSLFLCLGALLAWQVGPDEVFGLQGVLWLGSIALLVISCLGWVPKKVAFAEVPWTRVEGALFASIVALSLFTHLAWLNDLPWRYNADEYTAYLEAMRFYRGPAISLFTTSWYSTGMPSMPMALSGWLMNLAGTDLGGVRASTALFGALVVVPLYLLGRLLQGRTFAALAAFLMAISAAQVHYSRVSLPNMLTPFFWTLCFYFLLKGLRTSRPVDFAWAGLVAGLSMYTYYATRLLPYLLILYVVYLALFHRRVFKAHLGHFALAVAGFFVGFGPLLAYFINNPRVWAGRGLDELVVPATLPLSWDALVGDVQTVVPLIWRNFLGLSVLPSHDHVYWGTLLLPVEAVLVLMGTGVLAWRWRQPGSCLVLLWGAVTLFISGPLIAESVMPAYVHWVAAFPAIYLAMALPPALWLRSLEQWTKDERRRTIVRLPLIDRPSFVLRPSSFGGLGRAIVVVGALVIAVANGYFYLITYPPMVPGAFEWAQGRFLATLSSHDRAYFVGNSASVFYSAAREMLAPQVTAQELLNPSQELPLAADPDQDVTFIFNDDEARYLPVIEGLYPGGVSGQMMTPGGPIGTTYRITAQGLNATQNRPGRDAEPADGSGQGLKMSWQGPGVGSRIVQFVGAPLLNEEMSPAFEPYLRPTTERDPNFVPLAPAGAHNIVWEGEVYADGGIYIMNLRTDGRAQLMLDGQVVVDLSDNVPWTVNDFFGGRFPGKEGEVKLDAGWHSVKLSLEPTGNLNGMEWSWTPPGGVQEIVPPWVLRHR